MASSLTGGILLVGLAAIIAVVILVVLLLRKGGQRDWAEPMQQQPPTGRAAYGAGATDYPAAPQPAQPPQPGEHEQPDPEPGPPQRIDDSQQFRQQNRPDEPRSE